jgi:stage V sporulation protein AE
MIYIKAFIASGLLCLLGQILLVNTRLGFIKIFILSVCAGAALTAVGIMDRVTGFGMAGIFVTIMDVGEALYAGFTAMLGGNLSGIKGFVILILSVFIIGIIFGLITGFKQAPKEVDRRGVD